MYVVVLPEMVRQFEGHPAVAYFVSWIDFRTRDTEWHELYEKDGHYWWRVTYPHMAEDMGVSVKQVRTMIEHAIKYGALHVETHQVQGWTDRANSYRIDESYRLNGVPKRADLSLPKRADVPISFKEQIHTQDEIKNLDETSAGPELSEASKGNINSPDSAPRRRAKRTLVQYSPEFDAWWKAFPQPPGRNRDKSGAWEYYQLALQAGVSGAELASAARKYASRYVDDLTYIKAPRTWLRDRGWETESEGSAALVANLDEFIAEGSLVKVGDLTGLRWRERDCRMAGFVGVDEGPKEAHEARVAFLQSRRDELVAALG